MMMATVGCKPPRLNGMKWMWWFALLPFRLRPVAAPLVFVCRLCGDVCSVGARDLEFYLDGMTFSGHGCKSSPFFSLSPSRLPLMCLCANEFIMLGSDCAAPKAVACDCNSLALPLHPRRIGRLAHHTFHLPRSHDISCRILSEHSLQRNQNLESCITYVHTQIRHL